jgi:hypothetical protein
VLFESRLPLRWARRGISGIRLSTRKLGGRRLTTRRGVREFLAAVAAATGDAVPTVASCSTHFDVHP